MRWMGYVVPLVFAVLVFLLIRYLKPHLQRRRHETWRKAGLLPDQVDPHGPGRDGAGEQRGGTL